MQFEVKLAQNACQAHPLDPRPALSDSEIQGFIDALQRDRRLSRVESIIAVELVKLSRECGYVDCSTTQLAQIGRCTMRVAARITPRLIDRGYFAVTKDGTERRKRFRPLKTRPRVTL